MARCRHRHPGRARTPSSPGHSDPLANRPHRWPQPQPRRRPQPGLPRRGRQPGRPHLGRPQPGLPQSRRPAPSHQMRPAPSHRVQPVREAPKDQVQPVREAPRGRAGPGAFRSRPGGPARPRHPRSAGGPSWIPVRARTRRAVGARTTTGRRRCSESLVRGHSHTTSQNRAHRDRGGQRRAGSGGVPGVVPRLADQPHARESRWQTDSPGEDRTPQYGEIRIIGPDHAGTNRQWRTRYPRETDHSDNDRNNACGSLSTCNHAIGPIDHKAKWHWGTNRQPGHQPVIALYPQPATTRG